MNFAFCSAIFAILSNYANCNDRSHHVSYKHLLSKILSSNKRFIFLFSSPNNQNYIHDENNEYNTHHYSLSSQTPISSRKIIEKNLLFNHETNHSNVSQSSSKVKWIGAVRTVTQLNQVRQSTHMSKGKGYVALVKSYPDSS